MRAFRFVLFLSFLSGTAAGSPGTARPGPLDDVERLFEQGQYARVVGGLSDPELQKLRHRDLPRAYLLLGESYRGQNEPDKALGVFQLAAGLFPRDINVLTQLAELLHRSALDDRARPVYERILRLHPNNAVANFGMAEIEHSTGFLEESAVHYEKCLTEWKDNPAIWRGYAQVLSELRDFTAAASAIERALHLDPGDADSVATLARFQRLEGLRESAYETLAAAVAAANATDRFKPLRPELAFERALWLLEDGRADEAMDQTRLGLELSPGDALGLWLKASVLLRRGELREAAADLAAVEIQERQAPFTARAAAAMLRELEAPR